ncbi:ABC transporter substrate-binding protein [Paraburkholderia sp. BL21I4N1]|uniref:ABC transporter substrate-binding protein n=1 Tax=Paraburkholderia sp. BL21I4N1 TaxID=1938801 RepID=UPI000D461732|nr:ABC transporter substrate-binding protein [Paraburkholderia sp. BL21I4N1]PQV49825.1 amino acid/amide ABC transporter substrate-binding protein (HAAT family) [Paraburkholderia sp. BL21I4N1]
MPFKMPFKARVGRIVLFSGAAAALLGPGHATAQPLRLSDGIVKIGVLTDLSGVYSAVGGQGAVEAVRMAADDFMKTNPGIKVDVIYADHQNKADIAASKAREWFDTQQVDMITDLASSGAGLAVVDVARQKNRIAIATGPSTSDLTGTKCTPVSVHYVYDTYALAHGAGDAMAKRGADSWYFIAADYAFGAALVKDTTEAIKADGGKVLGTVRAPLNTADFSSYMLQAQSSGAKVIGLANAGGDFVNAVKSANEFGIARSGKQQIAGLLVFLSDIHALGLQTAQGLQFATGFYWDRNDASRKWSKRFYDKMNVMPTQAQAGDYSSTMHYLEAVKAAGTDETAAVMKKMRELPINDFFATNGRIREDGRMVHDMYLVQVKSPAQSHYPWDYYSIKAVIPADQAFRPLAESTCPLVKKP